MRINRFIQKLFLVCFIMALGSNTAIAAEKLKFRRDDPENKQQSILQNWENAAKKTSLIGLTDKNELKKYKSRKVQKNDLEYTKYQQHYKGIPVYGAKLLLVTKKNKTEKLRGTVFKGIDMGRADLTPAYSADDALKYLKKFHEKDQGLTLPVKYGIERSELMIYINDKNQPVLIYLVSFLAKDAEAKISRPNYMIDANAKRIIKSWDSFSELSSEAIGGNNYNGLNHWDLDTNEDSTDAVTGSYHDFPPLTTTYIYDDWCEMRNNKVNILVNGSTYGYNHKDGGIPGDEVPGGKSPTSDVLGFAGITYQMFYDWYNMSSPITGLSLPIKYNVHEYGVSAYWDGEDEFAFGDGNSNYKSYTSLNVVAHEISHALSDTHGGIFGHSELSARGMEESLADMTSEVAENYFYGENDFLQGSRIRYTSPNYRRNMMNPREDCTLSYCDEGVDGDPVHNLYYYTHYYSGNDEHDVAGIFNRAFYYLATTYGWDTKKAYEVMLVANLEYWDVLDTCDDVECFEEGAEAAADAAWDLAPPNIMAYYDFCDVVYAFDNVGIYVQGCE